jgi:hypothetical protein
MQDKANRAIGDCGLGMGDSRVGVPGEIEVKDEKQSQFPAFLGQKGGSA